jgi:hypothetical protein
MRVLRVVKSHLAHLRCINAHRVSFTRRVRDFDMSEASWKTSAILACDLLPVRLAMQTNEPERPGVTPITLVVGDSIRYCLWIEQSAGPCTKLILRRDSDGKLFAAIGDEGVCNDYIGD